MPVADWSCVCNKCVWQLAERKETIMDELHVAAYFLGTLPTKSQSLWVWVAIT